MQNYCNKGTYRMNQCLAAGTHEINVYAAHCRFPTRSILLGVNNMLTVCIVTT